MGYSDYGAFVYRNAQRRADREDCQPFPAAAGELPEQFHAVLGDGTVLLICERLRPQLCVGGGEVDISAYAMSSPPRGCQEAWSGEIQGVCFSAFRYNTTLDLHLLEPGASWAANCGVGRGAGFEDD